MSRSWMRTLVALCGVCALGLTLSYAQNRDIGQKGPDARQFFATAFELLKAGQTQAAIIQFERGLEIDPSDYRARFLLGEAYLDTQNIEKAKQTLQKVVESAPRASKESALAEAKLSSMAAGTESPRPPVQPQARSPKVANAPPLTVDFAGWPSKPIKIFVGYAPGGATDVAARILAAKLSEKLGQPVVIENKTGGAGDLAVEAMLQEPADGYTLMLSTIAQHAINPSLLHQKFDPANDFSLIAMVCSFPYVLVVSPQSSVQTIGDIQPLAARTQISYSSGGIGSVTHLAGEVLAKATGAKLVHVPYRGLGPAMVAVETGEVQLTFATLGFAAKEIRQGKLRGIAVTSSQRSAALPELPTMEQHGIKEITTWAALTGPKGIPLDAVNKINAAVNAALEDPQVLQKFAQFGAELQPMTPEQTAQFIEGERVRWGNLIKEAGIIRQ